MIPDKEHLEALGFVAVMVGYSLLLTASLTLLAGAVSWAVRQIGASRAC